MANNAISVNVVAINGKLLTSAQTMILPAIGSWADENLHNVSTATCSVYVLKGYASNVTNSYQVTDSLTDILDALNGDTVADLTTVGALTVGTDIHFVKEVDHVIDVNTSTTATTVGGKISIKGGIGATTGAGGAVEIIGGTGGATAGSVGGAISVTSGVSGAGNGASGAVTVKSGAATAANTGAVTVGSGIPATSGNSGALALNTGAATTGNSGAITIGTGNATTGNSGDLTLSVGTASAVVGKIITANALVQKHQTAAINATATATAKQVATGYITSTSAAPTTITLPTGTLLGGELGASQGTVHRLYIDNTAGSSTITVAVAVNGILSALAAAVGASAGLLTIPAGVTGMACFELMFSSATAYTFTRVA